MWSVIAIGLFNSIMFPTIFTLAIERPRAADRPRVEPAGDGDRRRRGGAAAAGRCSPTASACSTPSCCRCCATPTSRGTASAARVRMSCWRRRCRRASRERSADASDDRLLRRSAGRFPGAAVVDAPARPRQFVEYAGGAPANVAVAVARLGGDARFVGMLGADMFGDMLADATARRGRGHPARAAHDGREDRARVRLARRRWRTQLQLLPAAGRGPAVRRGRFRRRARSRTRPSSMSAPTASPTPASPPPRWRECGAHARRAHWSASTSTCGPALWSDAVDPMPRLWQMLDEADLVKLCRSELDVPRAWRRRRSACCSACCRRVRSACW